MRDRRREAAHVLHWQTVRVIDTQVLVQHGKDLIVEDLELAYAVDHLLQRLNRTTQNHHIIQTYTHAHKHTGSR